MASGKKVGRKPRTLSTGEKQLIEEFGLQLFHELSKMEPEVLCKRLKICRASLYNYLNYQEKTTLPGYDLLKRAHEDLGFRFQYLDFQTVLPRRKRTEMPQERPGVLPFLELLQKDDIEVIDKKTVERENALELTVRIRFVS